MYKLDIAQHNRKVCGVSNMEICCFSTRTYRFAEKNLRSSGLNSKTIIVSYTYNYMCI